MIHCQWRIRHLKVVRLLIGRSSLEDSAYNSSNFQVNSLDPPLITNFIHLTKKHFSQIQFSSGSVQIDRASFGWTILANEILGLRSSETSGLWTRESEDTERSESLSAGYSMVLLIAPMIESRLIDTVKTHLWPLLAREKSRMGLRNFLCSYVNFPPIEWGLALCQRVSR